MKFFFLQHILNYTFYFAILGFYLGQLLLSYKSHDVPEPNPCSSCSAFFIRLFISLVGTVLCGSPILIAEYLIMKLDLWLTIICIAAIPQFIIYFIVMYYLTILLGKCTKNEEKDERN